VRTPSRPDQRRPLLPSRDVAVTAEAVAADPLATGWTALRSFFNEGMPALERALEGFGAAEAAARASGDPGTLSLWLLGIATALRYTRRPEPMEAGLARARELVNVIARTQSEEATIPYRTHVEAISCDLADVVPASAAEYVGDGIAYSDRTVRLARKSTREEWVAAAHASRGDLLFRRARDRLSLRRALAAHERARQHWPGRDNQGRAQAALGYGDVLFALGQATKTEAVAQDALKVFTDLADRYHEAAARLLLARALFALERSEALDEHAAATSLYHALGCRWEARRAEEALG